MRCCYGCLEWGANDLHMVQLMPLLPHPFLQKNPEWFVLLVLAYPGCLEKRPLKECCCFFSEKRTFGDKLHTFSPSCHLITSIMALKDMVKLWLNKNQKNVLLPCFIYFMLTVTLLLSFTYPWHSTNRLLGWFWIPVYFIFPSPVLSNLIFGSLSSGFCDVAVHYCAGHFVS